MFAGQAQLLKDRDRRDLCREISQKDRGSRNTTIAFKKIILQVKNYIRRHKNNHKDKMVHWELPSEILCEWKTSIPAQLL